MFALEITFQDGASPPELLFVRRPQALIGASESSHVMVEDLRPLGYQIRLVRGLGRRFVCKPTKVEGGSSVPPELNRTYSFEAIFSVANVRFHIVCLDSDLGMKDGEPPDKAGVRVLRRACSSVGPIFPAVVVKGDPPLIISFVPSQPVFIGRSKHCALRLDLADISGKHARLGFDNGQFWVEDLGSTNGTYVNQQQISGRVAVEPGMPVVLGRDVTIYGVTNDEQIARITETVAEPATRTQVSVVKYPVLFSVSEVARPAKVILTPECAIQIGRDPSCEMWLGAPHVSRKHCVVRMARDGSINVTDSSTNGTAFDEGLLIKGETLQIGGTPRVMDFGAGVTVSLCFNEEHEREFVLSNGSPWTFSAVMKSETAPQTSSNSFGSQVGLSIADMNRANSGLSLLWSPFAQLLLAFHGRTFLGKVRMAVLVVVITVVVVILTALLLPMLSNV